MAETDDSNLQSETEQVTPSQEGDGSVPQVQELDLQNASENISESIKATGNQLSEAVIQLDDTLSHSLTKPDTITPTEVGFAVFVALIGAFSAYLFNYFHWKTVTRRENQSRAGIALSKVINEIEVLAVEYWLRDYRSADKQIDRAKEVSLISKTRLIAKYVDIFVQCHAGRQESAIAKLESFKSGIYDVVTGDDFESRNRKASKAKALKISTMCADANGIISSLDFHS